MITVTFCREMAAFLHQQLNAEGHGHMVTGTMGNPKTGLKHEGCPLCMLEVTLAEKVYARADA